MAALGSRIRELRVSKNLTLEQVASETGLSVSFLSLLERNKVSISVDNLERLAAYYQVHMVHFFNAPDENPVFITRSAQIVEGLKSLAPNPASVTLLANSPNAKIEPLLVKIAPGKEEPHFRKHEADTLIYILEGRARLISEKGDEVVLQKGDVAYYINFPHRRVANDSKRSPLVFISITAPPTSSLDDLIQARQGGWIMSEQSK
jgi:transcriptional regulator with XRE-family HTH domain